MPFKAHGRQYDVAVFGATGYTGLNVAKYITSSLPVNIKWAIAGRSREKLEKIAADLKLLNPDRASPGIEVCSLNDQDLGALAKKSFVLLSTVGPYGSYGEFAFKACAENGTHYFDVTGEIPFVARMIKKYEHVAKKTGAMLFPQCGLESVPCDLVTWSLAATNRRELQAQTRDVNVSLHKITSAPSGGTLLSFISLLDNFSMRELRETMSPFALSPVPHPYRPSMKRSLFSKITGLVYIPNLGTLTTHLAARTDAAIVGRSWGLLSVIPNRKDQFYGPNFTFAEHLRPRNWLHGIAIHLAVMLGSIFILSMSPMRSLARRLVTQPGQGGAENDATDMCEYRGVGTPDVASNVGQQAYCRATYHGNLYYMFAMFMSMAAMTLLEEDVGLEGGVYTSACLGQKFIDRLDDGGFKIETKMLSI